MTAVIEVRGLSFEYEDGTRALEDVDFDLYAGETVALFGANGSGKTTFALHLNGILRGKGSISVCGLALNDRNLAEIRSKIGIVFQHSDEQLFMPTILEDVAFGPLNLGLSSEEAMAAARRALYQTGLEGVENKAPYHLSAGEKRKAAIAGVLAMDPQILVFDEPTTSLDPPAQHNLSDLLRRLPQSKLIITHDVAFAAALADRSVFFERGRIAGQGRVEEIVKRFQWRPAHGFKGDRFF